MALLVVRRIQRVRRLLLELEARFLAGRLVISPARVVSASGAIAGPQVRPMAVTPFPRRLGWLCGLVPGDAACFAGQLRVVLAEPEMAALLASCPQAVRIVQPLCRMLGIERADYAPGEALVPAVVEVARPARVESAEAGEGARLAQVTAGLGWVRFIPG
jgi:hypothetical protein